MALKLVHAREPRQGESPPLKSPAEEEGCWHGHWPGLPEGPADGWPPEAADWDWNADQDGHAGLEGTPGLDSVHPCEFFTP